jgi:hypothetical protein
MKITKHQPNNQGRISVIHSVKLLTLGLQKDIPTIWAVTDPLGAQGEPINLIIHKDGDTITLPETAFYMVSLISDTSIFHIFRVEQKIQPATIKPDQPFPGPPSTHPGPSGRMRP